MRSPEKRRDNFRIPLMLAFRQAIDQRGAAPEQDLSDLNRIPSGRGVGRGNAISQRALKEDLKTDLSALLGSVDLGSAVDLRGLDYVEKSILNYGMADVSRFTAGSTAARAVERELKLALTRHEPRLIADTLNIETTDSEISAQQTMKYSVTGDMVCQPLDVPYQFDAECDIADAKVELSQSGSGQ